MQTSSFDNDRFSAKNAMTLVEVEEGYARAQMIVGEDHLNALSIPHGGVYFSLADFAFGAAIDYVNNSAVTLNAAIDFIKSATPGDTVTAYARQKQTSRRIIRGDVDLYDQNDDLLATVHFNNYRRTSATS